MYNEYFVVIIYLYHFPESVALFLHIPFFEQKGSCLH